MCPNGQLHDAGVQDGTPALRLFAPPGSGPPVVVVAAAPTSAATFSAPSVIGLNGRPEVLAAQGTAAGS